MSGVESRPRPKMKHFWVGVARFILIAEFYFCWITGHFYLWFAQFFVALWINLFLIVSSHDFEEG
jgi:hypothetical protein